MVKKLCEDYSQTTWIYVGEHAGSGCVVYHSIFKSILDFDFFKRKEGYGYKPHLKFGPLPLLTLSEAKEWLEPFVDLDFDVDENKKLQAEEQKAQAAMNK